MLFILISFNDEAEKAASGECPDTALGYGMYRMFVRSWAIAIALPRPLSPLPR